MYRIVVIGGGASGLMASIAAAKQGAQVTLLEHNEKIGKKIQATGNGRCNLSNLQQTKDCYRSENPDFPWRIIQQFPLEDTISFFRNLGITCKEKNGWLYPYSEQASSVSEVLEMEARHLKVKIKTLEKVLRIEKTPDGFEVFTASWHYPCDKVIISCGSPASSVEGSCDSGYSLARSFGHSLIEPLPALAALKGKGNYFSKWAGCRMEGIITLLIDGEPFKKEKGELLFTDYGISGIAVFQISRYAVRALHEGKEVSCHLDLMPGYSQEELLSLIEDRQKHCPYKTKQELFVGLLPKKMISVLIGKKDDFHSIVSNLKEWKLSIKDVYSLKQAQVCSGGVNTLEITDSLESKIQPGIYFAGEVLDVDGPCGGYNLQWAWSSGAVAGKAAAQNK